MYFTSLHLGQITQKMQDFKRAYCFELKLLVKERLNNLISSIGFQMLKI